MKLLFSVIFSSLFLSVYSTDAGCIRNGKSFKNGELYRENHLRYKCNNGIMQPLGCYDQNGKDVDVGGNFFDKNNFKFHCYKNGPIIGYTYLRMKANQFVKLNAKCMKNGATFNEGETYRFNRLRYECRNGIMHILGCYDDNGKDVEPDQYFYDKNNLRYHCYRKGLMVGFTFLPAITGNNNTLAQHKSRTTCLHHNGTYQEGEEFRKSFLRWKCEDGIMQIKGCYDADNKDIEVGDNFNDDKKHTFHCYRKGKAIGYYWVPKRI